MIFLNNMYAETAEKLSSKSLSEVSKAIGQKWKKLTDSQKKPFEDASAKDAKRHEREMKQFTKLGYFTNSDGIKSTDADLTTRSFKEHVTVPKRRMKIYAAYVKN